MKQLDKRAVWLFFFSFLMGGVVWAAMLTAWLFATWMGITRGGGGFNAGSLAAIIPLAVLISAAFAFIWAKLTYHFYRYELTDLGFRKESGVIWKKYVTIPYARIQNVDINRGILARILGLSDLMIQTAGASASFNKYGMGGVGSEGRLPGVSKEDAEILRDELVRRASKSQGQGV